MSDREMTGRYRTPPHVVRRNAAIVAGAILVTVLTLRVILHRSPDSDFTVGGYNVHHLFTGLILVAVGGIPLALFHGNTRRLLVARIALGVGLGMALDEWVYLIATDGSNASYLLPVSWWGAVVVIGLALAYTAVLVAVRVRSGGDRGAERASP